MKSVVMISYNFPPAGAAGVYRPLRFVRRLPSQGWLPTVITESPDYYERYDPGLLDLVPSSVEILRVRNPDPWKAFQERRSLKFQETIASATVEAATRIRESHERPLRAALSAAVHRFESLVYRPDPAMFWIKPATKAAIQACSETGAAVVWATGGPWSSLVVARKVSLRTGIPYVLDLRDSWTFSRSEFEVRQPEWIKARDRLLLSRLFSGAQAVVLRYMSEAEAYFRAYPGALDPERIHIIPNGYDGSVAPFDAPGGDRCSVLYTGTVGPYWYECVLEALAGFKEVAPESARKLRLVFVGESMECITELSLRLGLSDIIEVKGLVPFSEVSQLQSQAHGLLLLGWKPARGHELGGSKIFGYLKAGRPIIAVLPRDEQSRILRTIGIQTIADAGSREEIIGVFKSLLDAWSAGNLNSLVPDRTACEMYSAEPQTRALVRALEGAPSQDPFRPGAFSVPPSLERLIDPEGWVKPPHRRPSPPVRAARVPD